MIKILVNGAGGRIGRIVTYELIKLMNYKGSNIELVALNEIKGMNFIIESYQRKDSVHGIYDWNVNSSIIQNMIDINNKSIYFFAEKDITKIPFKELGINIVLECSGLYGSLKQSPNLFLEQGVKRIIQTYPAETTDATIIMGVNHQSYNPSKHFCISNASCTTKALALPLQVLLDNNIEIDALSMDTTHATTASQNILESLGQIITHSTGATKSIGLVIPELNKKMNGMSYRVPTLDGSFANIYLVASSKEDLTAEKINQWMENATNNIDYLGRVGICKEKDAGTFDLVGKRENAIIILSKTNVIPLNFSPEGKKSYLITLISGYDNELGSAIDSVLLADFISKFTSVIS